MSTSWVCQAWGMVVFDLTMFSPTRRLIRLRGTRSSPSTAAGAGGWGGGGAGGRGGGGCRSLQPGRGGAAADGGLDVLLGHAAADAGAGDGVELDLVLLGQ